MTPLIETQLMDILKEYTDEMGAEVHAAFKTTAKDTRTFLKSESKRLFKQRRSDKHYADGWTARIQGEGLSTSMIVYNRLKPGLTHLLENGHQVYVNRRNKGRANGIKHIEPAEQKAIEELMRLLGK